MAALGGFYVADIFISYASGDRTQAAQLAEVLMSIGYSVWWDRDLLTGDDYRLVVAREMDAASAVIALLTPHSVNSRYIVSELYQARQSNKLIPVRAQGLSVSDVPVPLDTLHSVEFDDREGILRAVHQLIGPPGAEARSRRRGKGGSISATRVRIAFWSYAGVIGAVLTIVGNLDAAIRLARLARVLFENWIDIITWAWRKIIFFRIDVAAADAVYLTTLSLLFVNLVITSVSRDIQIARQRSHYLSMTAMLLVICVISCVGFATKAASAPTGLISQAIGYFGLAALPAPWPIGSTQHLLLVYSALLLFGVGVMFLLFVPIAWLWELQANPQGFANRLIRIVVGVALVAALNYTLVWIEDKPWAKPLLG